MNPYYACSTSSASSGSALPQHQHFWPHDAHAAPAAPSIISSTMQSIPEAEASEVWHHLFKLLKFLYLHYYGCYMAINTLSQMSFHLSHEKPLWFGTVRNKGQ